jgi:Ni,Fe-hydrogenase III small subunit/NAD-dependent dihydropyrimidine dehydrogenase PreA subunit
MMRIARVRLRQGFQAIRDLTTAAVNPRHRGLPVIDAGCCSSGQECRACLDSCPTGAISLAGATPVIDLGRCMFCGECERACTAGCLRFSPAYKLAASRREGLLVRSAIDEPAYRAAALQVRADLHRLFGRSLKIRQVSAGGCSGCELELNACSNVNFDMGRFGIDVVASPRHADCLLLTGPISENMAAALNDAWECMPAPKLFIAAGACAISGGLYADSPAVRRGFLDAHPPDLYIPGCPVHPLTVINGMLDLLGVGTR